MICASNILFFLKKILAIHKSLVYNITCCDVDSVEAWGCYLKW